MTRRDLLRYILAPITFGALAAFLVVVGYVELYGP